LRLGLFFIANIGEAAFQLCGEARGLHSGMNCLPDSSPSQAFSSSGEVAMNQVCEDYSFLVFTPRPLACLSTVRPSSVLHLQPGIPAHVGRPRRSESKRAASRSCVSWLSSSSASWHIRNCTARWPALFSNLARLLRSGPHGRSFLSAKRLDPFR
jgi:hypothetical protein